MLQTYKDDGKEFVSAFSKNIGNYEWNGITPNEEAQRSKMDKDMFFS